MGTTGRFGKSNGLFRGHTNCTYWPFLFCLLCLLACCFTACFTFNLWFSFACWPSLFLSFLLSNTLLTSLWHTSFEAYENTDNSELFVGFMVVFGFFLLTVLVLILCMFAFWLKRHFCPQYDSGGGGGGDQDLERSNSADNLSSHHHHLHHHHHHRVAPAAATTAATAAAAVAAAASASAVASTHRQIYRNGGRSSSFHYHLQPNGLHYHLQNCSSQHQHHHQPHCPRHCLQYDVPTLGAASPHQLHSISARRATIYRGWGNRSNRLPPLSLFIIIAHCCS